ncbi:LytTr DNA-binding domain-containing protein [Dyadobacter koreensis]|uniref:LytTr DNA-binding domain-containing protein n=1 Tax=Dyadobacter koreensis TaxID=408657 RepID=A0A1H6RU34_9BACT|nr:LytTR family DNA-binding domain-containing protein [Dyadobacter koreensis]SEI59263.1 LytTr DNA-binding domain-containing protein [Dyadobacter koreensis]
MKTLENSPELKRKPVSRKTDVIVHVKGGSMIVPPKTIMLLEGLGNYTIIHTDSGQRYVVSKTLKLVSQHLKKNFIRVHKAFIINSDFIISRVDDDRLLKLADGKEVSVSRRKIKETTLLLNAR